MNAPDIVVMLREWCEEDHADHDNCIHCVAANEIERLRAELAAADGPLPPWPITAAIDNRDLLDEITYDIDVPVFRRNQCRQAVVDFDRALSGVDAL